MISSWPMQNVEISIPGGPIVIVDASGETVQVGVVSAGHDRKCLLSLLLAH